MVTLIITNGNRWTTYKLCDYKNGHNELEGLEYERNQQDCLLR